MSSSTSSSNSASSDSAGSRTASPRKVFLKIFVVILLGMGTSMGILRLIAMAGDVSGGQILERVNQARAALPRMVEEEQDLVMVFGSSMVDAGFASRQFDREIAARGGDVKSFNFGFGGLNPYFQDYLARRIREAFDEKDRKLNLALIEFNPFQTTTSRWNGAKPVVDSFVGLLATPQEMWEIAKEDPARGVQMLNIYYVRDGISAEMITFEFGGFLRPPRQRSSLEDDEEATERRREVLELLDGQLEEDYPDYTGEDWWYPWQGAGTIPEDRSEETVKLIQELTYLAQTPRQMEDDKLRRIACCDLVDLHFEETLIEAFIRVVQTFQAFSDQVEVIMLPRNTEWIQYPPEAQERLQAVLERIRSETGVTIKDMQDLDTIDPTMFNDTTHLGRYTGDVPFTAHLVSEYAGMLGASEN